MIKNILLTGGSGFIGKNIFENLGSKYNITAPSHDQLDLLDFSSVNSFLQKKGYFDYILHTAIIGGNRMTGDNAQYAIDSMRMFFNIANNEKYFGKFFYFGSGVEYGKEKPIKKFTEENFSRRIPQNNWGLFKYSCAKYVESNPKFVNLRIFGAFGKWEDYRIRFISNSICKYIKNLPIIINRNIKIDFLYIDDLVQIVDQFLNKRLKYNAYNLTPTKSTNLTSIVKIINSITDKKVKVNIHNSGFSPEYTGDNRRLLEELPNLKFTNLEDAILELYDWYSQNVSTININKLKKEYF